MSAEERFYHLEKIPYTRLLGFRGERIEEGRAVISVEIDPEKHLQGLGVVHGGVIAGLADSAAGWAAMSAAKDRVATVELKVNYLRPARSGTLRAEARVVYKGRRIIVVEADVRGEEGLVAKALATYYVLGG